MEFPIKLLPVSDSDVDPTDDASLLLLLLLSFIEVAALNAAAFGSNVEDRFDFGDDVIFATTNATNATNAHDPTTIIAIFLELFLVSIKEFALPVVLLVLSLSDVTVELGVASVTVGVETGDSSGGMVGGGDKTIVTAVGFILMGLGVLRGSGKLIDKLNEKLLSLSNPRILLKIYDIQIFVVSTMMK